MPILWKWDEDNIADLPKNVMIKKWVPQQDILAHPNLKLFVTHGGLLRYHDKRSILCFIFGQSIHKLLWMSVSLWLHALSWLTGLNSHWMATFNMYFTDIKIQIRSKSILFLALKTFWHVIKQSFSVQEALYHMKPLLGIPLGNDQKPNLLR